MYVKLFSSITESSLMEQSLETRYVFLLLLAIADPEGYVFATDIALARRLNLPLKDFHRALKVLMAPDKDSNSKEMDGRRIVESDAGNGYRIVNYLKYRNTKDPEERRAYEKEYRKKYRKEGKDKSRPVNSGQPGSTRVNSGQLGSTGSTQAEAEAYKKADGPEAKGKAPDFQSAREEVLNGK